MAEQVRRISIQTGTQVGGVNIQGMATMLLDGSLRGNLYAYKRGEFSYIFTIQGMAIRQESTIVYAESPRGSLFVEVSGQWKQSSNMGLVLAVPAGGAVIESANLFGQELVQPTEE